MSNFQPIRGTHDLYADEMRRHLEVVNKARCVVSCYGFEEIATPIIEFSGVFSRTLGDTSDVVTKEMYTFEDNGGEQITLRPENTASIMRAFHSNGMQQNTPCRFFSHGPMFRYERPQKGRQRQFHQLNAELIGLPDPLADAEMVLMGAHILDDLGLRDRTTLELNTLGDMESRHNYRLRLIDYFTSYKASLSQDSRNRLLRNPMRILDSKDEKDQEIVSDAPDLVEFMNDESRRFFDVIQNYLVKVGVSFTLNSRLVRGLDYYCHTAFEFITRDLGSQGTVMGGGRYDGLSEQMGSPATPGVGWAAGIERLSMMIDSPVYNHKLVSVIPIANHTFDAAYELAHKLRYAGYKVDFGYSGNMKKRMKRADKVGAVVAVFLGDDELARNSVTVRDMGTGEQTEVSLPVLEEFLGRYL